MSDMDNQEVVDNEEINENAEATPSSPASELVDLVLSGDLHAANEKFKGIVEANAIESIEDEKLKIAQTLFAEEPEEEDDEEEEDDDDEEDDEDEDPVGENFLSTDEATLGKGRLLTKKERDALDADDEDEDQTPSGHSRKAGKQLSRQLRRKNRKEGVEDDVADIKKGISKQMKKDGIGPSDKEKIDKYKRQKKREEVEEVTSEQSFDPGEATTDAPLPENSFVQQIAQHLSGQRVDEQVKKKSLAEEEDEVHTYIGILKGGKGASGNVYTEPIFYDDIDLKSSDAKKWLRAIERAIFASGGNNIDLTPDNPKDAKKMMQAIQKKKLFVEKGSKGDSIVGTGPDEIKLEKAIKNYRD